MKSIILVCTIFFSLTSVLNASSSYVNSHRGHHVSKAHLHYVFNQIKQRSDVSQKALAKTFAYYERNRYAKKLSPNYLAIADYTKSAMQKRLYIIDLHSGNVVPYMVAHGVNSGEKGDRVWDSSNVMGSHKTPFGFFKIGTKEKVTSKKGYKYLGVEGLEWKNKNAKAREILLHTAWYVESLGRSYGCFAIRPQDRWQVFSKLKKALLYSYTGR